MNERVIRMRASLRHLWWRLRGPKRLPAVKVRMGPSVRGWVVHLAVALLMACAVGSVGVTLLGAPRAAEVSYLVAVVTLPGALMGWQALSGVRLGTRVELRVIGRLAVRWVVCTAVAAVVALGLTRAEAWRGSVPWAGVVAAVALVVVAAVFARVMRAMRDD